MDVQSGCREAFTELGGGRVKEGGGPWGRGWQPGSTHSVKFLYEFLKI